MPPSAPDDGGSLPVGRNAAWLTGAELGAKIASIVFVVVVARALGVEQYGWFVVATALAPVFLVLGSLGLHQAVVRIVVRGDEHASTAFATGFAVRTLTAAAAVLLATAAAPLLVDGRTAVVTVAVVSTALALDATVSYWSSAFEVRGTMRPYSLALVLNRFASTALAVVAYALGGGLLGVLSAYLAGSAGAVLYVHRAWRRSSPAGRLWRLDRATAVTLLREGAPLGVAGLLNMLLLRSDTVLVTVLLSTRDAGLYGAAFRFYESFVFVAYAVGDAAFPRLSRQGRSTGTAHLLEAITALAAAAYAPLFVLSLVAAPWAVDTVFGEQFSPAADAVPWLTLATLLFAVTNQARTGLLALGRAATTARIAAAALGVNLVLNLLLIPAHGIAGAAAGTAAAAATEVTLSVWSLRRAGVHLRYGRLLAPAALAGAGSAGVLIGAGLQGGAAVLVGIPLYLLLLAAAAPVLPEHLRRRLTRRSRHRPAA